MCLIEIQGYRTSADFYLHLLNLKVGHPMPLWLGKKRSSEVLVAKEERDLLLKVNLLTVGSCH